jgi:alpha-L-rhamnosidase
LQDTYPSWLYCVKNGATSVYERWDSWMPEKGFQDPQMNSFHMPHLMASVVEWLMADVGGIQTEGPGFRQVLIQPQVGEGLSWAKASYQSINGDIAVSWKKATGGSLTLKVRIPPNTSAAIRVPKNGNDSVSIRESGSPVWSEGRFLDTVAAISGAAEDSIYVTFRTGSGTYDFEVVGVTE